MYRCADSARPGLKRPGAFALAHNVPTKEDVAPLMRRLTQFGGTLLKDPEAPPHGGFGGYLADPDDHAWEIAFNPAWKIDAEGHVHFGL